ncbi:hypothetical protein AYI69_g9835, partial [Smittium culicis]
MYLNHDKTSGIVARLTKFPPKIPKNASTSGEKTDATSND